MGEAQVIPMRRPFRTTVVQPLRVAENTGNRPVLCLCQDGSRYWCKNFSEDWPDIPVNEIVSVEVGKTVGAPVLDWAIVDAPSSLAGVRVGDTGRLGRRPMFGSKELQFAEHRTSVSSIRKDGNAQRFPLLVALWCLCNAEDIQMLYGLAEEEQVWSLDHGYWFGSWENSRLLSMPSELAGRTQLPTIGRGTDPAAWDEAAERVGSLSREDLTYIPGMIPTEWNVDASEVEDMITYVVARVPYTLEVLEDHARRARTEG